MELALATRTDPAYWWGTTDEVLATALEVLDENQPPDPDLED